MCLSRSDLVLASLWNDRSLIESLTSNTKEKGYVQRMTEARSRGLGPVTAFMHTCIHGPVRSTGPSGIHMVDADARRDGRVWAPLLRYIRSRVNEMLVTREVMICLGLAVR